VATEGVGVGALRVPGGAAARGPGVPAGAAAVRGVVGVAAGRGRGGVRRPRQRPRRSPGRDTTSDRVNPGAICGTTDAGTLTPSSAKITRMPGNYFGKL